MKQLIKKMKEDGRPTELVEMWYEEFIGSIQECYYLKQHIQKYVRTRPYDLAREYCKILSGFIYGLLSMGYISSDQKSAYLEDLIDEFDF